MSKEKKKPSQKPKYCEFTGVVRELETGEKPPKKIKCPSCKRRLEPSLNQSKLTLMKHRHKL